MPDINLQSYGPEYNGQQLDLRNQNYDGVGYNDILKFSRVENFSAVFGTVHSGSEDAADLNNVCRNVSLEAKLWLLQGALGFTVKGGSENISLKGEVEGYGKETDVDLGSWSDQSHDKTKGVHLNLWRTDRRTPIRVRVLLAETPTFEPGSGPYEYMFPSPKLGILHPIIVYGFMTLRRWGLFR